MLGLSSKISSLEQSQEESFSIQNYPETVDNLKETLRNAAMTKDQLYYLCTYRLLSTMSSSPTLLFEHLQICYNQFDIKAIDFADVENNMHQLAKDPNCDSALLELIVEVYFYHIRTELDGKETALRKLDIFLKGKVEKDNDQSNNFILLSSITALATIVSIAHLSKLFF